MLDMRFFSFTFWQIFFPLGYVSELVGDQ